MSDHDHNKTKEQLIREIKELRSTLNKYKETAVSRRKAEKKYRSLFEKASEAICLIDVETRKIVDGNPVTSRMSGYSFRELKSLTVVDLFPVEEQDVISQIFKKIATKGSLSGITGIHLLHKDGTLIPVEINAATLEIDRKKFCLANLRDITERALAVAELKKSEEKYRALFKHMFIGFALHKIILDQKGQPTDYVFLEVNDAFERLTGLKRADIMGKKVTEIIPDIKSEKLDLISRYGDVALKGEVAKFEMMYRPFNKWYSVSSYSPMRGYFVALFDDITHRKYWEEKLMESEKRFRDIAENALEWIWEVDTEGKYTYASPVGEKITGYRPDEILGKHFYDLFHPEDREALKKAAFEVFARMQPFREFVNRNIRKNGSTVWLSTSGVPVVDKAGKLLGYRGADTDITVHKDAEERLISAEKEWETTFNTIPDLILITDNQHHIIKVNKAMADRLGMKREDLIGRSCYEVIHGTDSPPSYCPHGKALSEGKEQVREIYEDLLKGHFIISASPIFDSHHNLTGIVEVARDITERKKMEEKLQEAAIKDELTGLFNRRGFMTLADQQCKLADRTKKGFSLLYLDLDGLKTINDELGHVEGDKALTDVAGLLKNIFRESDIIARIGGDEFAVLLPNPSGSETEGTITQSIQTKLSRFNKMHVRNYVLSLSAGLAHYRPDDPCSVDGLMARADAFMYEDKKKKLEMKVLKSSGSNFVEKRSSRRCQIKDTCWASVDDSGEFRIKNISLGGICVQTSSILSVDRVCKVTIVSPDNGEITSSGKVIRSCPSKSESEKNGDSAHYETAFQFLEKNKGAKKSLQKFINSLVR